MKLKRGLFASGAKQDIIGLKAARRVTANRMRNLIATRIDTTATTTTSCTSIDQVVTERAESSLAIATTTSILTAAGFANLGAIQIGGIERIQQIVFEQSFA